MYYKLIAKKHDATFEQLILGYNEAMGKLKELYNYGFIVDLIPLATKDLDTASKHINKECKQWT